MQLYADAACTRLLVHAQSVGATCAALGAPGGVLRLHLGLQTGWSAA